MGKELLKRTIFQFVTTPDFSTKNNELFFFFNQMFLKDGCSHDSGEVQSQGSVLCIVLMTRENKSWHQVPQKAVNQARPTSDGQEILDFEACTRKERPN